MVWAMVEVVAACKHVHDTCRKARVARAHDVMDIPLLKLAFLVFGHRDRPLSHSD